MSGLDCKHFARPGAQAWTGIGEQAAVFTRLDLDHNATTPLRPEARAAMLSAMDLSGSASSVHAEGRAARAVVERARESVAAIVGAEPRNVIFVSGATEANAMALMPHWQRGADRRPLARAVLSAIEHASARFAPRFGDRPVVPGPVDASGVADLAAWHRLLNHGLSNDEQPALVSLMMANNETGIVQPVQALADFVHRRGGLLHSDAAQAAGKLPISIKSLGADLLTLSAHKLGGPQGIGALVLGSADLHPREPLIGGSQERGRRGGTEPVILAAGFGAAAEAAERHLDGEATRLRVLRDRWEAGLRELHPGLVIFGEEALRLPNTSCFAVPGLKAETALMILDLAGVAVSSGAACSSGKVGVSHVLAAMAVSPDLAGSAMRVSLGWTTTPDHIEHALAAWSRAFATLSSRRASRAA